ncbi:glycosyltransferase [Candidatus Woesearchaeota archaeon]|nr:glycosyltransferase [Candidatus Woesearchaeota archaeon]
MKIYYASQSFYPHIGGVPTYLLNLCKEMVQLGNEVIEVHLRPAGEENYEEIEGIRVHRVPREPIDKELMKEYSRFKEAVYKGSHYSTKGKQNIEDWEGFNAFNTINEYFGGAIQEQLEIEPADIVHIHDFQLLYTYKYVPRGTPLILTWHIPFVKDMHPALKTFLVKHLNQYDKVVFSSEEYIDAAVKAGLPKEKTELIYPIANTHLFRKLELNKEKTREKYKLPKTAKLIISVQRIDPKSGHEQLIKALPLIKKAVPNAKLMFVGGESMSNKLSKDRAALKERIDQLIKDRKLRKNVIFTGTIEYHQLPEVYNVADVNALCSKNEGFGLAVTEGMACGLPVIGTNIGGIPLQIKDGKNGYLVAVGDHRETAKKIIKLLKDDELREKMGAASLNMVKEEFGINVGIEKHAALYNTLITEKDEYRKLEFLEKEEFKGIITDLDRTITDHQTKEAFNPDDYDKELLRKLKRLGLDLFLATSRNLAYCKQLAKKFKHWKAIICENGAVIYFPEDKKTITTSTYHMRRAKKILTKMDLPGTKKGKIMVRIKEEQEEAARSLIGKLADKVEFTKNVDEIIIVPKHVDKGFGVRQAMLYLNIELDKTICVGDGENDIDMFLNPGFKIALANAHPKLKELAHQVTKKASTKGIYEIIEKLSNNHS